MVITLLSFLYVITTLSEYYISQPYWPPWLVTKIALPFTFLCSKYVLSEYIVAIGRVGILDRILDLLDTCHLQHLRLQFTQHCAIANSHNYSLQSTITRNEVYYLRTVHSL
jgi:hypothetical protein